MTNARPRSAKEAKALGLKKYFTGKPCRFGHVAERFSSSWACVQCMYEKRKTRGALGLTKKRQLSAEQKSRLLELQRERQRRPGYAEKMAEYERRPEVKERRRKRRQDPVALEKNRLRKKASRATESGRLASRMYRAARRARLLLATPPWADKERIEEIYRGCPDGFQVDHLVPLRGVTHDGRPVSGLHVQNNLRYLTKAENMRRCNRMSDHELSEVESVPS